MAGRGEPRNLDDFRQLARGIWQHLPRKTVGPTYELFGNMNRWSGNTSSVGSEGFRF